MPPRGAAGGGWLRSCAESCSGAGPISDLEWVDQRQAQVVKVALVAGGQRGAAGLGNPNIPLFNGWVQPFPVNATM